MEMRDKGWSPLSEKEEFDHRGERDLDNRSFNQTSRRGYGEDYRGYTRGYNMNREPNYQAEYDRGVSERTNSYENYGRDFSEPNRAVRGGYTGQGRQRSHLRCRDIMTRNVTTCRRDTPLAEVARLMRDEDIGAIPVIGDNGKLEGIVTDRDLVVKGLTSDKNDAELRAEDCMSTDLFTGNQNDRLVEVINEMGDNQVRRIPVVDSRDRLVGIISMADIAIETNKDRELKEALEDISKPSSTSWLGRLANAFDW